MDEEELKLVVEYLKKVVPLGWAEQERLCNLILRLENRLHKRVRIHAKSR